MPFFKDKRYIKIEGKPVFNILSLNAIPCIDEMLAYWRCRIEEEGFEGLYIITTGNYCESADAYINPMRPEKNDILFNPQKEVKVYDYDASWKKYLNYKRLQNIDNIWQCMVDYDDTPRKGERAMIFYGVNPQKFQDYYAALRYKSFNTKSPLLFINAWNEWAEGMYLEPDTYNEYRYLEAVKYINSLDYNSLESYVNNLEFYNEEKINKEPKFDYVIAEKTRIYRSYNFIKLWLDLKLNDNAIKAYLVKHGYETIAIYGFGRRGYMVYKELMQDGVMVPFVIDQKADQIAKSGVNALYITDNLPECDLVIISVARDYFGIYKALRRKVKCDILSMHELCVYANEEIVD